MEVCKKFTILLFCVAALIQVPCQPSMSCKKVLGYTALGIGVLSTGMKCYSLWCQSVLDQALFDSLTINNNETFDFSAVDKAILEGAQVNSVRDEGNTPLHQAIKIRRSAFIDPKDHERLIQFLMQKGAVVTPESIDTVRAMLHNALKNHDSVQAHHYYKLLTVLDPRFKTPIDRYAKNLDPQIKKLNYALWTSIGRGSVAHVANLLDRDADPNYQLNGISLLERVLDVWPKDQLKSLDYQLHMINVLQAHGACDHTKSAYQKADKLHAYHAQLGRYAEAHKILSGKYERIMEALKGHESKGCPGASHATASPSMVTFSPHDEVLIFSQ